jgi:ADP-ribose pyrophosphatase YjhB (NUDIX family)
MAEIVQRIAMKAVIANDKGQVLMVRVADTPKAGPNAGKYGIPGGKLKAGEQWEEGLIREVFEETGLKVKVIKPLEVGEWRPMVQGMQLQIVAVFFACSAEKYEVTLSAENDAYEWVNLDSIEKLDGLEPDTSIAKRYLQSL